MTWPSVLPLRGKLQPYAWGSYTAIYDLLGVPRTGQPAAELWFGTHPVAPAEIDLPDGPVPISEALGEELPFLLKVLAAEQALSIQVHPSSEQARVGFDREQAAGIPLQDPTRNYRDPHHKPELIVALTPFRALAGIREPSRTLAVVDALDIPALGQAFVPLVDHPDRQGVAAVLRGLLTLPAVQARELAEAVTARARQLALPPAEAGGEPDKGGAQVAADVAAAASLIGEVSEGHPGDVGVVVALAMNDVTLQPGQGLFQPAQLLHAYVRGVGIEVMASSDNVLRGAFTAKHVDVDELMAIVDPTPTDAPVRDPEVQRQADQTVQSWPVPVTDFALQEIAGLSSETQGGVPDASAGSSSGQEIAGPAIVLAVKRQVEVRGEDGAAVVVEPGHGALVLPGATAAVGGSGSAFVASGPRAG